MKKITVTLNDEAEAYFHELMYSLPKNEDGSGMCSQSDAINYALIGIKVIEEITEELDLCDECNEKAEELIQKYEEREEKNN